MELKEVRLPQFADERGGTALLVLPESETALISSTCHIAIKHDGVCMLNPETGAEIRLNKEEVMAVASCLLNKLYFLRGGFAP